MYATESHTKTEAELHAGLLALRKLDWHSMEKHFNVILPLVKSEPENQREFYYRHICNGLYDRFRLARDSEKGAVRKKLEDSLQLLAATAKPMALYYETLIAFEDTDYKKSINAAREAVKLFDAAGEMDKYTDGKLIRAKLQIWSVKGAWFAEDFKQKDNDVKRTNDVKRAREDAYQRIADGVSFLPNNDVLRSQGLILRVLLKWDCLEEDRKVLIKGEMTAESLDEIEEAIRADATFGMANLSAQLRLIGALAFKNDARGPKFLPKCLQEMDAYAHTFQEKNPKSASEYYNQIRNLLESIVINYQKQQ